MSAIDDLRTAVLNAAKNSERAPDVRAKPMRLVLQEDWDKLVRAVGDVTDHRPDAWRTYTLRVRARVIDDSNAHGSCYALQLEQRDFIEAREIWVDASEIIEEEL